MLFETREIHSCRKSWRIYELFGMLQALPQMQNSYNMKETLQWRNLHIWQETCSEEAKLERLYDNIHRLKKQTSKLEMKTELQMIVCVRASHLC